jgi:hypothetical protein
MNAAKAAKHRARFEPGYAAWLSKYFPKWQIAEDVVFWCELPEGKTTRASV